MMQTARHTLVKMANRYPQRAVSARRLLRRVQRPLLRSLTLDIVPAERVWPDLQRTVLGTPERVMTPEMASMLVDRRALALKRTIYEVPSTFASLVDDAVVYPGRGVLLDPRGEVVVAESYLANDVNDQYYRLPSNGLPMSRSVLPGHYLCLRSSRQNYYHTLIDNLARLVYLRHPDLAALPEIKLLCPGPLTPMEAFFLERLALANVCVMELQPQKLYRVEHYLLLSYPTERFSGYLPGDLVNSIRDAVWPDRPPTASRHLYISRTHASKRRVLNEEAVWNLLARSGFERVIPEMLSPEEQVALFYDAAAIVAPHGAGLTNILFSPPSPIIELMPTPANIPYYYFLSKAIGHSYHYQSGTAKHKDDDFVVDVERLAELLSAVEGVT